MKYKNLLKSSIGSSHKSIDFLYEKLINMESMKFNYFIFILYSFELV